MLPHARREGNRIVLPGTATAHSHAFQRAMRAKTQRKQVGTGSFWSWREAMYRVAQQLDPQAIYDISHFAFVELALCGVTAVGEFHYVHHQQDGTPYDDRTVLAEAVIRAARDAGLRITLLRTLYERAAAGEPPLPEQRRFCDGKLEDALADVERLAKTFATDPCVRIGIAPHSVRAVRRESLRDAARFAHGRGMAVHMHVSEQVRENEQCHAEHGCTPLELLASEGVLDGRFVAVHATHVTDTDAQLLGTAKSFACICRTTERDLGDGASPSAQLVEAGVQLCTGVDSYASSDPFEEARAIELDDRATRQRRHSAADAPALLAAMTSQGYDAIGFGGAESQDGVSLDAHDPALVGADGALLDDAVVFAATPRAVRESHVNGRVVVRDGTHPRYDAARAAFERALESMR